MNERIVSVDEAVDMIIRFFAEVTIAFFPLLGIATGLVFAQKSITMYPALVAYALCVLSIPACFVRLWLRYKGVQREGGVFTRRTKVISMAALLIPCLLVGSFFAMTFAVGFYAAQHKLHATQNGALR
jgi:hypothetical protein